MLLALYHHSRVVFFTKFIYCFVLKEFERSEIAGRESSWFVWFKTEYELAKFERALLEAWQELFQVCMCVYINSGNETVSIAATCLAYLQT